MAGATAARCARSRLQPRSWPVRASPSSRALPKPSLFRARTIEFLQRTRRELNVVAPSMTPASAGTMPMPSIPLHQAGAPPPRKLGNATAPIPSQGEAAHPTAWRPRGAAYTRLTAYRPASLRGRAPVGPRTASLRSYRLGDASSCAFRTASEVWKRSERARHPPGHTPLATLAKPLDRMRTTLSLVSMLAHLVYL